MMKKANPVRTKKKQSTYDEFVNELSPKEKFEFEEGYKDFVLSEVLLAIMAQDEISVRELAKMAGVYHQQSSRLCDLGQKKTLV